MPYTLNKGYPKTDSPYLISKHIILKIAHMKQSHKPHLKQITFNFDFVDLSIQFSIDLVCFLIICFIFFKQFVLYVCRYQFVAGKLHCKRSTSSGK